MMAWLMRALGQELDPEGEHTSCSIGASIADLKSPDALRRRSAAASLESLASDANNKVLIVRAGGITPLVAQLRDADRAVRKNAAGALLELAYANAENKVLIARVGITPLVALLADADAGVRQKAAGALLVLAGNAENQVLIGHLGGIAPLLGLLGDADAGVRRNAVGALWNLANTENRVLIVQAGGIARLVALLVDPDPGVRKNATGVLARLSYKAEHQLLMVQAGGIPVLVALLGDEDQTVRRNVMTSLSNLAEHPEHKMVIAREGGIARLVALLSSQDDLVTTRMYAVDILKKLVNVSLWYDEDIAVLLKAQLHDVDLKVGLEYILSHWIQKPEAVSLSGELSAQDRTLTRPSASFQQSSQGLEAPHEASLTGLGACTIHASEVRLSRHLGRGAFGEVYEAIYHFQKVAVKKYVGAQLRLDDRAKVVAEITLMATLKHPSLVAFLGVIDDPSGAPSLVMECAESGSLYHYLGAHRDLAWAWRLRVADELARGLAYLHDKNVVHRDIKSLNVVLDRDLHAKWCDFGLAVLKQHATSTQTHRDQAVGTARWMAPELFLDEPVISRKSDIWSYGMVLFELATQTVPYARLNEQQVMFRLANHKAEEVPETCKCSVPKFAGLMEACWTVQEERPDASTLVEVLAEARMACAAEEADGASASFVSGFIGLSTPT